MSYKARLVILWLVALPFISWNGIFEGAKIFFFWVGGIINLSYWLLRGTNKLISSWRNSDFLFLAWIFVLFIASLFGPHPLESVMGGSYRHQGVIFFFLLLITKKIVDEFENREVERLRFWFAVAVFGESLITIVNAVDIYLTGGQSGNINGKPIGTLGEPNAIAGFLAIGIYFIYEYFLHGREKRKITGVFMLVLVSAAVLLTSSVSGLLALLIVFAGSRIKRLPPLSLNMYQKLFSVGLLILFSGFLFKTFSPKLLERPVSYEDRLVFWKMGVGIALEKPVFGWGAETGEYLYDLSYNRISMPLTLVLVDRSHNLFIDVFMWSGFVGLFLFIVWVVYEMILLLRTSHLFAFFVFLAWLLFASLQPLGITHWIVLFLIFSVSKRVQIEAQSFS